MQHVRHGRTARDAKNLARHLLRRDGNVSVEVISIVGLAATDLPGALAAMRRLAPHSASAAFHHVSLSPSQSCAAGDLRADADRVLREMGVDPATHPHALVVHGKSSVANRAPCHAHLVVAHWDLFGQALADGWLHLRLERVAREIEHDRGETLTPGRHDRAVAKALRTRGRPEVAEALEAAAAGGSPRAATTPGARQRLRRSGVDDVAARAAVRAAWAGTTSTAEFCAALADAGLSAAPGAIAGVWIVTAAGGAVVGALDRIVRQRRAIVAARMEETDEDRTDPALVPVAARPGTPGTDQDDRPAHRPPLAAPRTPGRSGGTEPAGSPARDAGGDPSSPEGGRGQALPYRGSVAPIVPALAAGRGIRARRVRDAAAARVVRELNTTDLAREAARRYLARKLAVLKGVEHRARKQRDAALAPIPEPAAVIAARAQAASAREAERLARSEADVAEALRDALLALKPIGFRRAWWWLSGRLRQHADALAAELAAARAATRMVDARVLVSVGMKNRLRVEEEKAARERQTEVALRRHAEKQANLCIVRARIAAELLQADLTLGALPVPDLFRQAEAERRRLQAIQQADVAEEALVGRSHAGPR